MRKQRVKSARLRVKCDRLSELPDSLILSILGLLPMTDVVRTTILSKRWQNLWTTVNCLNFDDSMVQQRRVERALNSWRGTNIFKFEIDYRSQGMSLTKSEVDSWMHFAMDHHVQELNIHMLSPIRRLQYDSSDPFWSLEAYSVPQDLYSCSVLLKHLSLKGCSLDIEGDVRVQWNQLKRLTIHGDFMDDENAVNQILSGCPQLEIFHLSLARSNHKLIFRSSSLKELSINTDFYSSIHSPSSELVIWTPNLETLEMSGIPYPKCLLMDVSSLTHVTLGFNSRVEDTLRQIIPTIQHVKRLTLVECCIKALGAVKYEFLPSPFPNVKLLQLNGRFIDSQSVLGVVETVSNVETLVLRLRNDDWELVRRPKIKRDVPPFLLQLRTVDVSWTNGDDSVFPLIEFLLKYASKLEKLVFREESGGGTGKKPWESLFLASRRLLKMSRSSNCTIDFV